EPIHDAPDRLPPERYQQLYEVLCQSNVSVCRDDSSYERLKTMRGLYEGYAEALSRYLSMPLPPWMAEHARKDNWQAVAKLRARAEEANSSSAAPDDSQPSVATIASLIDHSHDF
ncbi:MAG TPA: hypothetical protein VGR64_05120, partial [Terracidiphilus sp.]|nr:hypothetical protein [Terracidiphilus sp.]